MAGRGAGVGVVVIAVGEVCAMVEQKSEAAFTPLIAIALQVVAAKLVDHDDDDQLRPGVVGGTEACAREGKTEQKSQNQGARRGSHCGVVYSVGDADPNAGRRVARATPPAAFES